MSVHVAAGSRPGAVRAAARPSGAAAALRLWAVLLRREGLRVNDNRLYRAEGLAVNLPRLPRCRPHGLAALPDDPAPFHRPGQARAEGLHRELQRPLPRRSAMGTSQPHVLSHAAYSVQLLSWSRGRGRLLPTDKALISGTPIGSQNGGVGLANRVCRPEHLTPHHERIAWYRTALRRWRVACR